MNKKYQREMEQIHAPRELIDRTKREVREAGGQTQKAGRKTLVFFPLRQAAALAAALVLIVLVSIRTACLPSSGFWIPSIEM